MLCAPQLTQTAQPQPRSLCATNPSNQTMLAIGFTKRSSDDSQRPPLLYLNLASRSIYGPQGPSTDHNLVYTQQCECIHSYNKYHAYLSDIITNKM